MAEDIPVQGAMVNLYLILSSVAYVRNHLLHFDTVLAYEERFVHTFIPVIVLFCRLCVCQLERNTLGKIDTILN